MEGSRGLLDLMSGGPDSPGWVEATDRLRGVPDRGHRGGAWTELRELFLHDHRPAGILLAELLQADDPVAWEEFHARFRTFFEEVQRKKFPRLALQTAQDCLDDVLGELALRVKRYEPGPGSSFKAWLLTVARNLIVDYGRRYLRWGRGMKGMDEDVADPHEASPDGSDADSDLWRRFAEDFHGLGSGWTRLAWHLKYCFEERDPLDDEEEHERGRRSGLEPAPFFAALPLGKKGVRRSKGMGEVLRCAELTINTAVHRMTRALREAGYAMLLEGGAP
jgi:hypothetical protein